LTCQDTAHWLIFHAESPHKETDLNKRIIASIAAAVFAVASPPLTAVAQAPAKAPTAQRVSAGPTVSASVVGIRRAETEKKVAPAADTHMGAGRNIALMVVGGAALIIGAVIGGTPGVLIAVAGAAIGLYGLYNFVQ